MGAINSTAPVLQAEFVPKTNRGTYVCVNLTLLNFGIFLSYWFDYAFAGNIASYAWRIPVILQCIFIFPVFIGALLVPETPRWLISHSRPDEAREVLMKLSMGRYDVNEVDNIYDGIVKSLAIEDSVGATSVLSNVRHLFKSDDIGSRRRFLIACSVQFFQQLGGINGIIYYAGTIFSQSLGFDSHMSALMSGFLNTWFFIASFIPWVLIDRIGRRPLLISMVSLMAICFAVMCGLVRQIQLETSVAHSCGAAAAAMLFIYEGAFTIGFQATVWVYPYVRAFFINYIQKSNPGSWTGPKFSPSVFDKSALQGRQHATGSSTLWLSKSRLLLSSILAGGTISFMRYLMPALYQ